MSNTVAGIQATVLRWARESQGYSIEDVARRLKRAPAEIASWEAGTASPTYSQLETLAYKLYKRPLAVFFLPEPPQEPAPKQEFRTLPEADLDRLLPDTRLKLRLARSFQLGLKELTDNANPAVHKIFRDIPVSPQADVHREALVLRQP